MCEGNVRETSIALTPVGGGRFEVYINDRKVYDRSEAGEGDFYPSLRVLRGVKTQLVDELAATPA